MSLELTLEFFKLLSFSVIGPRIFNSLPRTIKEIPEISAFKNEETSKSLSLLEMWK